MRPRSTVVALSAFLLSSSVARTQEHSMLVQLEIQNTVTRMLHAIDALDWPAFRAAFAPEIRLDFTSLFPGEPETLSVDSLVGRWEPMAHGYDATHHQLGPVVVLESDERRATAEAHVIADHHLAEASGGPLWSAVGHYRWTLEKRDGAWNITSIVFQLAFQHGNRELPGVAVARGTSGRGRPRR
jgi:hypothetical protein